MRSRTDRRTEKQVEHSGDLLMAAAGFSAVRFSQARATQQTPGIPDRRYYSPERRAAVWWEAKTEIGRPSAFQTAFRAMCEAVGEEYVIGTESALVDWLERKGFAKRVGIAGGLQIVPAGASFQALAMER
jgi:hypothetical protein